MLSIQLIREHPEVVERAMARRHSDTPLGEILALDTDRRKLLQEADALKARRNEVSRRHRTFPPGVAGGFRADARRDAPGGRPD